MGLVASRARSWLFGCRNDSLELDQLDVATVSIPIVWVTFSAAQTALVRAHMGTILTPTRNL